MNFFKKALQDIIEEVSTLTHISVDEQDYKIQYYMGGDWKFLATITGEDLCMYKTLMAIMYTDVFVMYAGIDSAKSTYSCIWCKCPSSERFDPTCKWSITDVSKGARTIQENTQLGGQSCSKFSVSHQPLFPSIPLENIVIDNLPLFQMF